MTKNNLKNVVYGRLEAIANAEKVTLAELRELSRELLIYVPDTHDIDIVNRLLGVVTPVNRRALILYFGHFLPWVQEKDNDGNFTRFGKMFEGDKKVAKRMTAITEFLAVETNNFWTWQKDNVQVDKKDLAAPISRAIANALKGHEATGTEAMTEVQVMEVVMQSVSLGSVIEVTEKFAQAAQEAEAEVMAQAA